MGIICKKDLISDLKTIETSRKSEQDSLIDTLQ